MSNVVCVTLCVLVCWCNRRKHPCPIVPYESPLKLRAVCPQLIVSHGDWYFLQASACCWYNTVHQIQSYGARAGHVVAWTFFVALFYHQLFTMIVLLVKKSQRKPSHVSQTNGKKKKGVPLLQQSLFRTIKKRSVQMLNFISLLFYIDLTLFLYDIFGFYSHWHFRRKYFSS